LIFVCSEDIFPHIFPFVPVMSKTHFDNINKTSYSVSRPAYNHAGKLQQVRICDFNAETVIEQS
jgi:hypothetical protein